MSFVALIITLLLSSLPTFLKSVPSISKTSNTHVPISSAKISLVRGDALSKSAGIEKGALVIVSSLISFLSNCLRMWLNFVECTFAWGAMDCWERWGEPIYLCSIGTSLGVHLSLLQG